MSGQRWFCALIQLTTDYFYAIINIMFNVSYQGGEKMNKDKIIKVITIIVSLIIAIGMFGDFLESGKSTGNLGLFLFHVLPLLVIPVTLVIYVIKSIFDIIKDRVKISAIDIIIIGLFVYNFVSSVLLGALLQIY